MKTIKKSFRQLIDVIELPYDLAECELTYNRWYYNENELELNKIFIFQLKVDLLINRFLAIHKKGKGFWRLISIENNS